MTKTHELGPAPVRPGPRLPFFSKPLRSGAFDSVLLTIGSCLLDTGSAAEDVMPGEQLSPIAGAACRQPSIRTPAALKASSCADLIASGQRVAGKIQTQVRGESLRAGGVSLGRIDQWLQVLDFVSLNQQETQFRLLRERTDVLDLIVLKVEYR